MFHVLYDAFVARTRLPSSLDRAAMEDLRLINEALLERLGPGKEISNAWEIRSNQLYETSPLTLFLAC